MKFSKIIHNDETHIFISIYRGFNLFACFVDLLENNLLISFEILIPSNDGAN